MADVDELYDKVNAPNVRVFGRSVTITHIAGGSSTFDAIFEAEAREVTMLGDLDLLSTYPMFKAEVDDIGLVVREDTTTILGINYVVKEVRNDGTDMAEVRLHKVRP